MPRTILYLTGMSGCGKTLVRNIIEDVYGIPGFYTGTIGAQILGDQKSDDPLEFGKQFKRRDGYIRSIMEEVLRMTKDQETVVLDALRSQVEWDYVRTLPHRAVLIAAICNYPLRMKRVQQRNGGSFDEKRYLERESLELGLAPDSHFDIPKLIAQANHYINTTGTIDSVRDETLKVLEEILNGTGA